MYVTFRYLWAKPLKVKTFKTLAEFKRQLAVGDKLSCTFHQVFAGRDDNGAPLWKDEFRVAREVAVVQSNAFALRTVNTTTGETNLSWCHFPRARECRVENNRLIILHTDTRNFRGAWDSPEFSRLPLIPLLSYEFAE